MKKQRKGIVMSEDVHYEEKVASPRTTALFAGLSAVFILLLALQLQQGSPGFQRGILIVLVLFFVFSTLNYRILNLRITSESLRLQFGVFSWTVPLENVAGVELDSLPWLMRNGGAGVHFMMIRSRYRVSFNVLEFPRVVISLREKVGPVVDVSFTTRNPEEVMMHIEQGADDTIET